jgi:glycosyltransferase involved in cell wall biosynthesis
MRQRREFTLAKDLMRASTRILVPRVVDAANVNAQALNARSLLSRFGRPNCEWHCVRYGKADPAVVANPTVKITRLAPWRFWAWHMMLFYQQSADAIFYPGVEWFDRIGLQWRDRTRRSIPVIATLEGLAGGPEREERLSRVAGHPVYCLHGSRERLDRFDYVMHRADHIVAISPFLAKMARELYGDKCSVIPMGVDLDLFAPAGRPKSTQDKKVLSVGNVRAHKRPEVFLSLAERFRDVQFRWIGEGDRRQALIAEAARRGLHNLSFPGALTRAEIADELRTADVFVMPSRSEGVPKATQEAVASGVPCIVFGCYESPSVIDGENGYVVWSDSELEQRLGELLENASLCAEMGRRGCEMSRTWDWDVVAPQWERGLVRIVESL